jgi:hypothetical protein
MRIIIPSILLVILFTFSSCASPSLSVQTEYWSQKDLASVRIGTPDPEKDSQNFGQHVYISWKLPSKTDLDNTFLQINVRLKNGELTQKIVPIKEHRGVYCYPIIGEDFSKKGGLLSYKIVLVANGKEVDECRHIFWVDTVLPQS